MFDSDSDDAQVAAAPLSQYVVLRSSNIEEINDAVSRHICPQTLNVGVSDAALDARLHAVTLRSMTLGYVTYGGRVDAHLRAAADSPYVAHVPVAGTVTVETDGHRVTSESGGASVMSPGMPTTMHWSPDSAQIAVRIPHQAMRAELVDLMAGPFAGPLKFQPHMALTSGHARSWTSTITWLISELGAGNELLGHPLVVSSIEQLVMRELLIAQPHTYTQSMNAWSRPVRPRALDSIAELMEAAPETPFTLEELAQHAGVSARALQKGFRQHLNVSPLEYLRSIRLRRAREELLRANPGTGATVTDIAIRWGFAHLGWFSKRYREHYGEPPSETLRRNAGRTAPR